MSEPVVEPPAEPVAEPVIPAKEPVPEVDPVEPAKEPEPQEPAEPEAAPKPDEPDDTKDEPSTDSTYQVFDDPALNQITAILDKAEIPVADAKELFQDVVEKGDISKLDMAALEAKVGKDNAEVIKLLTENYTTKFQAKVKETLEVAHGITGGEDNLKSMQDWIVATEGADPEFAKDMVNYRQMLDSTNPISQKAAIQGLFDRFKSDPNTTISADVTSGDTGKVGAGAPLSRSDYTALIEDAISEGTYDKVHPALQVRRSAGIKLGL